MDPVRGTLMAAKEKGKHQEHCAELLPILKAGTLTQGKRSI